MLDTLLAILVLGAVLLFGALLTAGNERQRKAIDSLDRSYTRWAEHDLGLKRAAAARQVRVADPQAWLEDTAARLLGLPPRITSLHPWQAGEAKAMVAACPDGRSLVVTPLRPAAFRKMTAPRKGKGAAAAAIARTTVGVLGSRPARVPCWELNMLSAGTFFDIEAGQAWEALFHEKLGVERLYLFEVPAPRAR